MSEGTQMYETLAIDPGAEHCGMVFGAHSRLNTSIIKVWEERPRGCHEWVCGWLQEAREGDSLVVEEFRLYPGKAAQQSWSKLETVEVIGVLRYLWERYGQDKGVAWVEQGANIKKPIQRILRAKGVASVAKAERAGGHCFDAELHFYRSIWTQYDGIPGT